MRKLSVLVVLVVSSFSCMKAAGQSCAGGEFSCQGTAYAECVDGVMVPFECRGARGCYAVDAPAPYAFSCDTSAAVAGEACPVRGATACAVDGGADLLRCGADGGWSVEVTCGGGCGVVGDSQPQGACN